MNVTAIKTPIVEAQSRWVNLALVEAKGRQAEKLSVAVQKIAQEAVAVWNKVLFPSPRIEAWKYTNPADIANGSFSLPTTTSALFTQEQLAAFQIPGLKSYQIVFVDGEFSATLSSTTTLPQGVTVTRIQSGEPVSVGALGAHTQEAFTALATALLNDGICIGVARGVAVEIPFHIINVVTAAAESKVVTPRLFLDAQESSQVTVIESFVSNAAKCYLSLPVAEIRAAQGAVVDCYKFQDESLSAYQISDTTIEQGRDSTVRTHIISLGGAMVRNNVSVRLNGSATQAVLNGLSVLANKQHVDNSTLIHHIQPASESREHFKGIYADQSRGVFSGTITVDQIAQKTNAFQSNQTLLLSPTASIETRPQLKIWADDVKCTHGATIGQLDAEALFYLRSRGIDRETARNFLVHAFASEVLTSVRIPALRDYIEGAISTKLEALQG